MWVSSAQSTTRVRVKGSGLMSQCHLKSKSRVRLLLEVNHLVVYGFDINPRTEICGTVFQGLPEDSTGKSRNA